MSQKLSRRTRKSKKVVKRSKKISREKKYLQRHQRHPLQCVESHEQVGKMTSTSSSSMC